MRPAWLKVWLLSPKQIRAGTAMPGLPEDLPDRNQVAEDILAYLRAMRRRKLPTRGAR
jgi:cytochrome c1